MRATLRVLPVDPEARAWVETIEPATDHRRGPAGELSRRLAPGHPGQMPPPFTCEWIPTP